MHKFSVKSFIKTFAFVIFADTFQQCRFQKVIIQKSDCKILKK